MNANKRSDFTVEKSINGKSRLLVTEIKGQWHQKLYKAAKSQLSDLYSIHPDAENQGIYIVLWFGKHEKIAGRKNKTIKSPEELKTIIESEMPRDLRKLIDVFVLDVSKELPA